MKKARIEKVYKNGNVVVEGKQYRTYGKTASEAGKRKSSFSWRNLHLPSPEIVARYERVKRRNRIRDVLGTIERASLDDFTDKDVAVLSEVALKLEVLKAKRNAATSPD